MNQGDVTQGIDGMRTRNGALAFDGRFRVAFVLFGGMVVLQSSQTLDAPKIVYLVGTFVCLVAALGAVRRARRTPAVRLGSQWLMASGALAVLIAISFLIARASGTPPTDWLRDAANYALFAAVPIFALDAQASASRKLLVGMLVVAGLLGGVSWSVEWLSRRQILELPFDRLVFPSAQVPSMLYVFAMAKALTDRRRTAMWVALAGVTLGFFIVTGTRSSLLLLIGPFAMAALAGWALIRHSLKTLVLHWVVALAVLLVFQLALALPAILGPGRAGGEPSASGPAPTAGPTVAEGPTILDDRFTSLPTVITNPATDDSVRERVAQYRAAWTLFVSSPIVGVGPGHPIEWIDVSGYPRSGFTADTPLVMPAKFGLLGIVVFLGFAGAYGATVRRAVQLDRRSEVTLTLVGFGVLTILGLPLGFLVEDKGASLALILLLALAFTERRATLSDSGSSGELHASIIDEGRQSDDAQRPLRFEGTGPAPLHNRLGLQSGSATTRR